MHLKEALEESPALLEAGAIGPDVHLPETPRRHASLQDVARNRGKTRRDYAFPMRSIRSWDLRDFQKARVAKGGC